MSTKRNAGADTLAKLRADLKLTMAGLEALADRLEGICRANALRPPAPAPGEKTKFAR